jgi:predicted RecB family nuclease
MMVQSPVVITATARPVTGTMLYDLVCCERRVHHDLHTGAEQRDPVGDFVRMLWEGGRTHEQAILAALSGEVIDLRDLPSSDRAAATQAAMSRRPDWILGARLELGDRVGMPDLLRFQDGEWKAGDVKSGSPVAADGCRPRFEYAVQVAFYARMLEELAAGSGSHAFVIGADGTEVVYDLDVASDREGRSIAQRTKTLSEQARGIRDGAVATRGALSASCKMCHWHTLCERELVASDDLTLLAGVGRSIRDALLPIAPTVEALARLELGTGSGASRGSPVRGVGADRLRRFRDRARLMVTPGSEPYATRDLGLRSDTREIHFDIEADPSRDGFVYLHGFWTREAGTPPEAGRYDFFFAETQDEEATAFRNAIAFLSADQEARIYYYSKYERSSFRQLARRYPDVCSEDDIEVLFDPARAIDLLFDVITPSTEWPTRNLSIKTLARRLGFEWGDADASGANSIAWYDEYARTADPNVRQRILDYNRDDVVASAVVLDGLRALEVATAAPWPPAA